ncbi:MAG: hypothetical protein JO145_03005 [Acidobacteriaceae bacterium]|nr:hypothetical protein [Acidobacteriaceae bacterium]MBV9764207.1 hypothetical protein [Acidobacteriaceae bacterium]
MSLLISDGAGAPKSLAAYESAHPKSVQSSPTHNGPGGNLISPSRVVTAIESPFGLSPINISIDKGTVKASETLLQGHIGPTASRFIFGSRADADAGGNVTGSAYVSANPKDGLCVGVNFNESVGAGVSATATRGPISGSVGKDESKDLLNKNYQVCVTPKQVLGGVAAAAASIGIAATIGDVALEALPFAALLL